MSSYDIIRAFLEKIKLWKHRIQTKNFSSFPRLNELLQNGNFNYLELSNQIVLHLDSQVVEFEHYFPDLSVDDVSCKLTRNPFIIDIDTLNESLQEEAIELKNDTKAKDEFKVMDIQEFWVNYLQIYPNVATQALRIIMPFSSTYLCESGFSSLTLIKTKQRCQLEVENDLLCALSSIKYAHMNGLGM